MYCPSRHITAHHSTCHITAHATSQATSQATSPATPQATPKATPHATPQASMDGPARTRRRHLPHYFMVRRNTENNTAHTSTDARKVADAEIRVLAPAAKAKSVAKDVDASKLAKKEIFLCS
jgi:hypothetical protein